MPAKPAKTLPPHTPLPLSPAAAIAKTAGLAEPAELQASSPTTPTPPRASTPSTQSPKPQVQNQPPPSHPLTGSHSFPPLSPADSSLFSAYIAANFNVFLLATQKSLPVDQLLDWVDAPHIRARIDSLHRSAQVQLHLTTLASANELRADALLVLSAALSQDVPPERRRAATTILRHSLPLGGKAVEGWACDAANSSSPRRSTLHSSPIHNRKSKIENSPFLPHHIPATSPIAEALPAPRPAARPSKKLDNDDVISAIVHSLLASDYPDENSGLATLHAFCAPDARFDGKPIPPDFTDFLALLGPETVKELTTFNDILRGHAQESTTKFLQHVQLIHRRKYIRTTICLARVTPDDPWLLASFTRHPPESG